MDKTGQANIVVVGAGFVGLSFALAAKKRGLDVEVYERKARPEPPTSLTANVIAVNRKSREFLEGCGVFAKLTARFSAPYVGMSVFDGEGAGAISFRADEADLPELGHIVDQTALRAALADTAQESGLTVHWESAIDVKECDAALIVAADGSHSETREKLGLKKFGYVYDQQATVCVAEFEQPHGAIAWQWFHETGPVALLPLGESNKVAVIWSSTSDLSQLEEGDFQRQLADVTEHQLGELQSVGPRFSFPLMQQHVFRYVAQGVALLGDAAHTIHPLAGQGANLGFADAQALATILLDARIEGRSFGDVQLLKRYERERIRENRLAGLAMESFYRLFGSRQPAIGLARSLGLRFVHENTALKRLAISVAAGGV
ncbi:MAG: FAD-dependent monooxygenase [Pseudomonadales bacterium]|nr:FAD-dependent monooxygenase [Pseudomonadales bacterium]MBO6597340.1 FAD-dependent monooxygenase [Pseudomonadales bacterium]MBO6824074.1 FAD-dependent monooxygenase [Pseudomonadales bacterium]